MDKIDKNILVSYVPSKRWIDIKEEFIKYFASLEPVHTIVSSLGIKLKHSGYFAMIPSNLDLEALLAQHPVTDYFFVRDETGHIKSVNINGTIGACFDPERLIYIIGLISSIPAKNKDSITENGYVPINSKLIRNAFKDYLPYLDYLIMTGVLCTDGQYIQGEKSMGYKFTEQYANAALKRYDFPAFQGEVEAIPKEIYSEEDESFVLNTLYGNYDYLSHWYYTKKLHINKEAAMYYAYSLMATKINQGQQSWDINSDKSSGDMIVRKHPISQYQAALYNINSIDIGDYKVSIDTHVHRLHSVITNIQKDYRNFLTYDGQELVSIDIKNSQPYLCCALFNPQFWSINNELTLNLYSLPENIQRSITTVALPLELEKYFNTCSDEDFALYKKIVADGKMYETIAEACQKHLQIPLGRKEAKVLMFYLIFSSNQVRHNDSNINKMKKIFSLKLFPKVANLFKLIKHRYVGVPVSKQHNRLACLLQSIESEIILHRCCKRIWEEMNHQVPVFTIHDSIATTIEHKEYVRTVMQEELFKAIGVPPTLSEEYWKLCNVEYPNLLLQ